LLNTILASLSEGVTPSTTAYESIATVTVGGGGSASIDFTSIPVTYTHLQIRCIARSDYANSGYGTIRFNSDSGSNYNAHYLYSNGSSANASAMGQYTGIDFLGLSQSGSNIFGAGVIDILDYANTNKYKVVRSLVGGDDNSTNGRIALNSGLWMSTSAITGVTILSGGGGSTFQQYSQFALYGIKGA
jgi:hypothetical protein